MLSYENEESMIVIVCVEHQIRRSERVWERVWERGGRRESGGKER